MNSNSTLEHTRRLASDAVERAGDTVRSLRSGVQDYASRGMSSIAEGAVSAQRQLGQYTHATTRYVGEHPLKTALIAAAIGAAVAGVVMVMRSQRSRRY